MQHQEAVMAEQLKKWLSDPVVSRHSNSTGRKVMTKQKMRDLIRCGFGQGRGERYVPWIRVTRSMSSQESGTLRASTPVHTRQLHLLSWLEYKAALLLCWLGAEELREQYPLWTDAYVHPRFHPEAPYATAALPKVSMQEVAHDLGIKQGCYVGTDIPYVATTDLVAQFGAEHNDLMLFVSCKPAGVRAEKSRVDERLALEAEYARRAGAVHCVFDGSVLTETIAANLDLLAPGRGYLCDRNIAARRSQFACAFNETEAYVPLRERMHKAMAMASIQLDDAIADLKASIWLGLIPFDMSSELRMNRPLRVPGKTDIKHRLFSQLSGVTA